MHVGLYSKCAARTCVSAVKGPSSGKLVCDNKSLNGGRMKEVRPLWCTILPRLVREGSRCVQTQYGKAVIEVAVKTICLHQTLALPFIMGEFLNSSCFTALLCKDKIICVCVYICIHIYTCTYI